MENASSDLKVLAADERLLVEDAFSDRVAALDKLDYICEALRVAGRGARRDLRPALGLRRRLEALNEGYCARVRHCLQTRAWTPSELRAELNRHTGYGREASALHWEHEPVDRLVDGVLGLGNAAVEPTLQDRDFVHLEDSPVRVLLDLVDHVPVGVDDCFCDLGAGLGRASIVVHWLTGARCEGVEVQPEYHAFASALAKRFGLDRVCYQLSDARAADLSRGTVFYLFTPFKGRILHDVWHNLETQAQARRITVCTYGAISLAAAQQRWLAPAGSTPPHEFALAIWQAG